MLILVSSAASHAATQVGSAPYRASATGAGNSHSSVFSADGKHVAFVSHANNLVTNDDLAPHLDLFMRDLAASNTVLVSVSTNSFGGANDNVGLYTLSSNAQVIAFDTAANNLAPGDANRGSDIYARDLLAGTTKLVTMNADGTGSANGPSSNPLISEDGRYIIFESLASNLVTNDFNGTNDIFIHDLTTGLTELVSVNADGTASPDGPSHSPSISADGLTIAFVSHATNLVQGVTNTLGEVYGRNVADGITRWAIASHLAATRRESSLVNPWRLPFPNSSTLDPYIASDPVLSADGRYVAFKTLHASVRFDLQRPTNSQYLTFTNSEPVPPFRRIDSFQFDDNPRLAVACGSGPMAFTPDGRYAAYATETNIVFRPGIVLVDFESLFTNVFCVLAEGCVGCPRCSYITNVSVTAEIVLTNFTPVVGRETWTALSWLQSSPDASRVFFIANATNLVAGVTNRAFAIYGLDLFNRTVRILSTNRSGLAGSDLPGIVPSVSPDGSRIVWDSPDDNIVADDLNRAWDVFVRNVDTGGTQLISARHPDLPAASSITMSRLDLNPGAISANGQRIAMLSLDNTLAPNDTNNWRDLFVGDLVNGTNFDVSRSIHRVPFSAQTNFPATNTAVAPSLSADGHYVAFAGELTGTQSTNRTIYWRDLQVSSNRVIASGVTGSGFSVSVPALSPNGQFLAFHSADYLVPGFPDGNNVQDVFVYQMISTGPPYIPNYDGCTLPVDFIGGRIASRTPSGIAVGNGPSVNPAFSPDSFWILFQSRATDLTGQPLPPQSQYQLYGRGVWSTNVPLPGCGGLFPGRGYSLTKLISYTTTASPGPSGISTDLPLPGGGANPRFSADSRYVAFESSPNLIHRHDLLNDWVVKIITHPDPMFSCFTNRARFTNDLVCSNCSNPTLSAEGRFVVYESFSMPGATRNVAVKDLQTGEEELISVNLSATGGGNGASSTPLISHDARFVVFASKANDLVPGDNNRASDIFVRDRLNGVTHCLSRDWSGTGTGNRVSSNPIMSADGRTVAFQSFASDLVPSDYNDTRDVFVVTLGGPDTDGDGMDDDWEMAYFSTLARDGVGDFDNDSANDLAEFRAGTNPANDTSILQVLAIRPVHRSPHELLQATVIWSAVPGRTYRVQFKDNVTGTTWMDVPGDVVAATPSASKIHTPTYYTGFFTNRRFYRVLLAQ